jgi:hypothetical protein
MNGLCLIRPKALQPRHGPRLITAYMAHASGARRRARTAVTTRGVPVVAQPPTVARSTRCHGGGGMATGVRWGTCRAWQKAAWLTVEVRRRCGGGETPGGGVLSRRGSYGARRHPRRIWGGGDDGDIGMDSGAVGCSQAPTLDERRKGKWGCHAGSGRGRKEARGDLTGKAPLTF